MAQEVWVCENQTVGDILAKKEYISRELRFTKWPTTCELIAKLGSGIPPGDFQFPSVQLPRTGQGVL